MPGGQCVGVVGAQLLAGGGVQVLEIGARGGDESSVAEAVSGVEENRVGVGLPQGVCGVGSQGGGVGAQSLAEGSVAFDLGPGLVQGVGAGTGRHVACGGAKGFAGGTLDEVVDAHLLVRGVGGVVGQAEPVQAAQRVGRIVHPDRVRGYVGISVTVGGAVFGEVGEGWGRGQDGGGDAVGVEQGHQVEHGAGQARRTEPVGVFDGQRPGGGHCGAVGVR